MAKFRCQHGSKSSGAETMICIFQQINTQNPGFDLFSKDAIKTFYILNRDVAMKKLKSEFPEIFDMLLDKYNDSSNAFYYGLSARSEEVYSI